ncbi:fasciclin 1 Fas1 domain-containing isoform 1-T6 [Cochliomyia hominivorax]
MNILSGVIGNGKIGNRFYSALCMKTLFTFLLIALPKFATSTILDKLRDDPDLSQTASLRKLMPVRFYSLLEQNPIANSTLSLRSCTLFVPTNEAFQRHHGTTYVLYHMATVAMTQDQLTKTIPSDMDGNPPLYITKNRNGDIYVNNARIIPSLSVEMTNDGKRQVMHIIDEVLVPLTSLPSSKTEITNPDAFQFLQQADLLNIGENRLRSYRSQVTVMRKENLYQSPGGHTFLIPVDEGFKQTTRSSLVDNKVIDGHVILNNVIFTSAAQIEVPQTTAAFEDNIKVTVSFSKQKEGKMYVKSNTLLGDSKHATGVVLAEIVKANIPVRNGVVHLIHRPLMIIDTTVTQFLQSFKENENGALRKFLEVIMDIGGQVLDDINNFGDVTILAPSNEAWNSSRINNIIRDGPKMREILNMHIIKERLNVEKIKEKNQNLIAQVPTVNNRTFLYFNVNGEGSDEIITVEGGGVNATILESDVASTNGYVHIIDKVLGVPYTTVLGKLESDPMLSDSYKLGQFSTFNEQLNNTQRRFTYFVTRDKGWQKTSLDFPSVHKKLFMKDFAYHSRSILERHLVIADRAYTMKDLVAMTKESGSIVLPTFRDSLKIKVEEEAGHLHDEFTSHEWTGYFIIWNYKKVNVYRPDVECTNGVIHVIDYPMLEEKDIVVSGGTYQIKTNVCILFANLFMIAIANIF